jgi:hypothetical protein
MASESAADGRREGFDPVAPMLAWLGAVQEMSTAALASVDVLGGLGQAQWRLVRDGMALMSELPLTALDEGTRGLTQLREALHVVQAQMAMVDEQLATVEQVLKPVQAWSKAWTDLMGDNASPVIKE